jgi:hypothetical protein
MKSRFRSTQHLDLLWNPNGSKIGQVPLRKKETGNMGRGANSKRPQEGTEPAASPVNATPHYERLRCSIQDG